MLIVLVPNSPMATAMVLVNDTVVTGFVPLEDTDWGAPSWDHVFTSPRSAHGARAARGVAQMREVRLSLRCYGTSKDDLASKLSTLAATVEQMRRFGGTIVYRANGQTYRQYLRAVTATLGAPSYDRAFENRWEAKVVVAATCAPWADSDPMEFYDGFDVDTLAAGLWTYEAGYGAAGNLVVSNGAVIQASPYSLERRLRAQHTGFPYGDVELRAMTYWAGATNGSQTLAVVFKILDANNFVRCLLGDNGSVTYYAIEVISGGGAAQSTYPNTASRLGSTSGLQYVTLVGRIEGNVVTMEAWTTKRWSPAGTPDYIATLTLNAAMADKFGELVTGGVGISILTPAGSAGSSMDNFACEPFVYRRRTFPSPGVIRLAGAVPGDGPARMDIEVATPASVNNFLPWGFVGWSPRARPFNMLFNGGGEGSAIGWTNAGVVGFQNNTGAITAVATAQAKYGGYVFQSATPGGNPYEGPIYPLYRRFKKGQRYTAVAWVRQTVGTAGSFDLQIGATGDRVSSGAGTFAAVGASTPFVKRTLTWQPVADTDAAYLGLMTSSLTGLAQVGTFQWDGVAVYEGAAEPTTPPLLPQHTEGLGASPPIGLYSVLSGLANVPARLAQIGSGLQGYSLSYLIPNATGANNDTVLFVIDPALMIADDYTGTGLEARGGRPLISGGAVVGQQPDAGLSEIDVEVYARLIVPGNNIPLSVLTYVIYGNSYRYTKEYGSAYKTILANPNSTWLFRRVRLGTFTMSIAPDQSRWVLTFVLSWGANATGTAQQVGIDFFEFVPVRRRAASPTAKPVGSGYPYFINNSSSYEAAKLIRSDLSVEMAYPPSPYRAPDHGLMGPMIELMPGLADAQLSLCPLVPDDTTAGAGADDIIPTTASIRFSPRPRYAILRPVSG